MKIYNFKNIGLYKNSYMRAKFIEINNEWFNIWSVVIVITHYISDVEHHGVHTEKTVFPEHMSMVFNNI